MAKLLSFFLSFALFFTSFFGAGGWDPDRSAALADNALAAAGYKLTVDLRETCYNALTHELRHKTDGSGMPYVWTAASFVEMLSDAYRLFPGSLKLKTAYADALKNLFARYLAKDQTIQTPAGETAGVSYYNSSAGGTDSYYYDAVLRP